MQASLSRSDAKLISAEKILDWLSPQSPIETSKNQASFEVFFWKEENYHVQKIELPYADSRHCRRIINSNRWISPERKTGLLLGFAWIADRPGLDLFPARCRAV